MSCAEATMPATAIDAKEHLGLVGSVVRPYARSRAQREELAAAGAVGLCVACSRFNPGLGYRFSTYARYWIRAYVQRTAWERPGRPFAVGRRLFDGERPEAVERALNTRAAGGDAVGLAADRGLRPIPDAVCDRIEAGEFLEGLRTQERAMVSAYFGMDGGPPRQLAEIGREHGVTRQRAQQVVSRAMDALRRRAGLPEDEIEALRLAGLDGKRSVRCRTSA